MGFSVPNIFTNVGNPVIDANAVNANYASISTVLNYIFDVRFYGAKWDGVTDDAAAIQTAINDASAAGGGTVLLPPGTGAFGAELQVPEYVRLVGSGLWITQLKALSSTMSGISVTGKYAQASDFFMYAPVGSTGTGLGVSGAAECSFRNLQISEFVTGVVQTTSPNSRFTNVLCTNSSVSDSIGFAIDGKSGGNVSSIYRDCSVAGLQTGTSSQLNTANAPKIGWLIYSSLADGDCGDLNFFNCSTSNVGTASKHNFANVLPYSDTSSDIIWSNFVFDLFTAYGFQILGGDNSTMVKMRGGFLDAAPYGTTTVVGIYGSNRGLLIEGVEWIAVDTSFGYSAFATQFAGQDVVMTGCTVNGWDRGSYVNGGKATIIGNRFYGTANDGGSGVGRNMNAVQIYNSTGSVVVGNLMSASVAGGIPVAIYFDATANQCVAIANDLTSTNITTPVDNASTTSKIADNLGYNPVGAMTAPTVGASPWTYTNRTGVDQTLNVSGGTISAISANGVATGLTSGSFLVPAGNTLVVTYTAAPTISASGN